MKMSLPPSIAQAATVMLDQRDKGIRKYGMSVEVAKLTARQWANHAEQELADGAVYMTRVQTALHRIEHYAQYAEQELKKGNLVEVLRAIRIINEECKE